MSHLADEEGFSKYKEPLATHVQLFVYRGPIRTPELLQDFSGLDPARIVVEHAITTTEQGSKGEDIAFCRLSPREYVRIYEKCNESGVYQITGVAIIVDGEHRKAMEVRDILGKVNFSQGTDVPAPDEAARTSKDLVALLSQSDWPGGNSGQQNENPEQVNEQVVIPKDPQGCRQLVLFRGPVSMPELMKEASDLETVPTVEDAVTIPEGGNEIETVTFCRLLFEEYTNLVDKIINSQSHGVHRVLILADGKPHNAVQVAPECPIGRLPVPRVVQNQENDYNSDQMLEDADSLAVEVDDEPLLETEDVKEGEIHTVPAKDNKAWPCSKGLDGHSLFKRP